ncbi:unnamed protein product [Nezara viridula]|uniref:Uncharacterized protein n=1 Tax=Nezara viridula TaxID=85310 RepID=A0A9P0HDA0_NEZVI|nr:unnamed protein product [Nezara viridula]
MPSNAGVTFFIPENSPKLWADSAKNLGFRYSCCDRSIWIAVMSWRSPEDLIVGDIAGTYPALFVLRGNQEQVEARYRGHPDPVTSRLRSFSSLVAHKEQICVASVDLISRWLHLERHITNVEPVFPSPMVLKHMDAAPFVTFN